MKPIDGWKDIKASTGEGFAKLPAGGYVCRITNAIDGTTKDGKTQMTILFDIVEGEYAGFFKKQFDDKSKTNVNASWGGIYRQLTEGESARFFKGVTTAIEESNPNYTWNWDETTLKGKLFGVLFGEEEFINDKGEIKVTVKPRWIRSIHSIMKGDFKTPEIKRVKQQPSAMDGFAPQDDVPNF